MDVDAVQLLQTRVHASKDPYVGKGCENVLNCDLYDTSTSDGENKCLNIESGGWGRYDCKGTNGRLAFAPTYCSNNYASYRMAGRLCCPNECIEADEPVLDLTTPEGQNSCLIRWVGPSWKSYDCDGAPWYSTYSFNSAVNTYCTSTDNNRVVPAICCKNQCDLKITGTTAPPATTTSKKPTLPDGCPGTDSPGGDTEVTDAACLDAEHGFGPGFTCGSTEMYCSTDSGDGITVGACCPTKCKAEFENKKKNNKAENKAKNDLERRVKRNEDERSRKKAESARKKIHKDTEWQNKRDLKEAQNKNEEGERKNKRGLTENARKNEQGWKKNKAARRKAANKRESKRKTDRAEGEKKNKMTEKTSKNGNKEGEKKNKMTEQHSKNGGKHAKNKEKSKKKVASRKEKKSKRLSAKGR